MDNEERTSFIIHHLSEGDDPNDLIYQICQKDNISWQEAEALVKKVQIDKKDVIIRKQFPLLFAVALVIFLGGLACIGYSIFVYAAEISLLQSNMGSQVTNNLDAAQIFTGFIAALIHQGPTPIFVFITGIAMVLGSLVGMRDAWASVLNR